MSRIGRAFGRIDRLDRLNISGAYRRFTEPGLVLEDRSLRPLRAAAAAFALIGIGLAIWALML